MSVDAVDRCRRIGAALGLTLALAGGGLLGHDVWLQGKAWLAGRLIARAFQQQLQDGQPHRPWPWADTYPLAILESTRLGVRLHVMEGASGSSMAFGPGHLHGTARPNEPGHTVLAGHRDTSFSFLRKLRPGDRLLLTTRRTRAAWRVAGAWIVDERDLAVLDPDAGDRLTLLTCYPFGGVLPSPLRYVVTALPEGEMDG